MSKTMKQVLTLLVTAAVGALVLTGLSAPAADAAVKQVPCSYNHHKIHGHAEYACRWYTKAPVVNSARHKIGTIHAGSNWVVCQHIGYDVFNKKITQYNHWYAYTLSDQGKWGWVNAYYASGGGNNGKFAHVPACNASTKYNGRSAAGYPPQFYYWITGKFSCQATDLRIHVFQSTSCQWFDRSDGIKHVRTYDKVHHKYAWCSRYTTKSGHHYCDFRS